jgi:hypothetical protein
LKVWLIDSMVWFEQVRAGPFVLAFAGRAQQAQLRPLHGETAAA